MLKPLFFMDMYFYGMIHEPDGLELIDEAANVVDTWKSNGDVLPFDISRDLPDHPI